MYLQPEEYLLWYSLGLFEYFIYPVELRSFEGSYYSVNKIMTKKRLFVSKHIKHRTCLAFSQFCCQL